MIGLLGRAIFVFGGAREVIAAWRGRRRDRPGWPGGYAGEDEQRRTRDELLQWSRGQSPQTRADAEDFWSDFDQLGHGILRGGIRPTAGGADAQLVTAEDVLPTGPVVVGGNTGELHGASRLRVHVPALALGALESPFLNFLCDGPEDWHVRRRVRRLATPWREMLLNLFARGSQLFQEATESLQWWRMTRRPGLLSTEMSAAEEHVAEMLSRLTSGVESQGSSGAADFWFDLREFASSLQQVGPAALLEEWQEDVLNRHRGPDPDDPEAGDWNADVAPEGQCIVCLGAPWPRSSRASILMCGHVQHVGCWLRLYHNRVDDIGCRGCQLGYRRFCGRLQIANPTPPHNYSTAGSSRQSCEVPKSSR